MGSRGGYPRPRRRRIPELDLPLIDLPRLLPNGVTVSDLYDYQLLALRDITHWRWGRIALATNAGKGAIIGLAASLGVYAGQRVLILADEVSVFDALQGEIEKWADVTPDVVKAGVSEMPDSAMVLAMVPTLARRIKKPSKKVLDKMDARERARGAKKRRAWRAWLGTFGMVLLDEADRATAAGWQRILTQTKNADFRVGFSGSFGRAGALAERKEQEAMGPVLRRVTNMELVERDISARPTVHLHPFRQDYLSVPFSNGYWYREMAPASRRAWAMEHFVTRNTARHQRIADLIRDEGGPATVVVEYRDHGEALAAYLTGAGIDAEYLHGDVDPSARREALGRYLRGEISTLVVTRILDRGSNMLGTTRTLIFASGAGSPTQTVQRVGRGLRRAGGKERVSIHDIIDLPPVDHIREKPDPYAYLDRGARKRLTVYEAEGFDVRLERDPDDVAADAAYKAPAAALVEDMARAEVA